MMVTEFRQKDFDEQSLHCTKCQWKGKGTDANVIDLYGVSNSKEVHCPECDSKIAVVVREDDDETPGESATDLSFQIG